MLKPTFHANDRCSYGIETVCPNSTVAVIEEREHIIGWQVDKGREGVTLIPVGVV